MWSKPTMIALHKTKARFLSEPSQLQIPPRSDCMTTWEDRALVIPVWFLM